MMFCQHPNPSLGPSHLPSSSRNRGSELRRGNLSVTSQPIISVASVSAAEIFARVYARGAAADHRERAWRSACRKLIVATGNVPAAAELCQQQLLLLHDSHVTADGNLTSSTRMRWRISMRCSDECSPTKAKWVLSDVSCLNANSVDTKWTDVREEEQINESLFLVLARLTLVPSVFLSVSSSLLTGRWPLIYTYVSLSDAELWLGHLTWGTVHERKRRLRQLMSNKDHQEFVYKFFFHDITQLKEHYKKWTTVALGKWNFKKNDDNGVSR